MSDIPSSTEPTQNEPVQQIGRNEPCPCGSGRKYKRCCGVGAAPKITPSRYQQDMMLRQQGGATGEGGLPAMPTLDPEALKGFDPSKVQLPPGMEGISPDMMMQVSQMLQRLPKAQLARLQHIMQKAMAGKDVTQEAQEFERTLSPEFQQMLSGFQLPPGMMGGVPPEAQAPAKDMTPEQAREIVAKAAAEGKITKEQAEALLKQQGEGGGASP